MIRAWIKESGEEIGILGFVGNEDMTFVVYADDSGDIVEMPLVNAKNEPRLTISPQKIGLQRSENN